MYILGNSFSEDLSSTKFQSLGLVFPFPVARGSFVMALGYQKIKDYEGYLKIDGYREESTGFDLPIENVLNDDDDDYYILPFDKQIEQEMNPDTEGSLSQWSFGLAMDLSPNFSAGLSINIYDGRRTDNLEYFQAATSDANDTIMTDFDYSPELLFYSYD